MANPSDKKPIKEQPNTVNNQINKNSAKKAKKNISGAKIALMSFLGFLCVVVLTVGVITSYILFNAISFVNGELAIDLDEYKANQNQTSFIYAYDENGDVEEIARLHGEENRVWVDLDDISPHMKNAFIALEDTRFEEHHGVDWKRTIGVIVKPSNIGQGGSTITQQLIKNHRKQ